MFLKNDIVRYGAHGVCKIADIAEKNFNGVPVEYYVLKPIYNDTSTIYVPVQNQSLTDKMYKVLSAEEIRALIQAMPYEESMWIDDEEERKRRYQEILVDGDRVEMVRMIKALYLHQREQQAKGRKLHMADDRFFKEAERMLYEEFALVLQMKKEEVLPFILEQLQTGKQKNCG